MTIVALVCALLAVLSSPTPAAAQTPAPAQAGIWTEAVVSVRDPDAAAEFFRDVGAWTAVARGAVTRGELAYWRLPATATARFLKICAPRVDEGCIRFVAFAGVAQRPIRLGARPWDTGGIYSLMIRTSDLRGTFDRAIAAGWTAESEPYRFRFGGSDLWNVVLTSPQGFNVALYHRLTPAFTDYPLGSLARAFNSMRMVRDQRASVAFYTRLGFTKAFDSDYLDPAPTPTNFSIPVNYATKVVRRAAAMHPVAAGTGRVELMQFVGFEGKDQAAYASPPNLGIVSLRFPVQGLAQYRRRLEAQGIAPVLSASAVVVGGLGRVDLFAVRDPDGNLSEFYEAGR